MNEMLGDIVKSCFEQAQEQRKDEGYIKLERVFATIPLPGIDGPFHSRHLWAGVMPFRACKLSTELLNTSVLTEFQTFRKKINAAQLNPDILIDIPNLVAKSFEVSREYIQLI
jgi:fatty acid synthase subunit alpha